MKDAVKFVTAILVLMPCALVLNDNPGTPWVNLIGLAYIFLLIGFCAGHRKGVDRMLDAIEKYEKDILNGN